MFSILVKKLKEKDENDSKKAKCEMCGIIDLREKFRKGKKYCSAQCVKRWVLEVFCRRVINFIILYKSIYIIIVCVVSKMLLLLLHKYQNYIF